MGEGTDSQTISALNSLGGNFKGEIAEVVAYNRKPGLAREKIEGYLAHKWGLEGSLPITHKYAVALPTFGGSQEIAFNQYLIRPGKCSVHSECGIEFRITGYF